MSTMYTLYKMPITHTDYDKVVNLCADMGILNVPSRENMAISVSVVAGLVDKIDNKNEAITFLVDELEVMKTEALSGDGFVLTVVAHSPVIEEMIRKMNEDLIAAEYETLTDDIEAETISFVLSYDYTEDDDEEFITQRLNEYLDGKVTFNDITTAYHNEDELLYVLDGAEYFED